MDASRRFEAEVLPHLDAAFNLARWLLRDDAAAEDAVQEAALRALRYIGSLRAGAARPWFLAIVRNACFAQMGQAGSELTGFEDEHFETLHAAATGTAPDPAETLAQRRERAAVDAAIRALPPVFREVIVLRELEGLAYDEIAQVAGVPQGTVMSRLARARERLRAALAGAGIDDGNKA